MKVSDKDAAAIETIDPRRGANETWQVSSSILRAIAAAARNQRAYEIACGLCAEDAGDLLGAEAGMLKLLFDPKSRKLLGVHIFGERATEIIHIGQAVLAFGGTIDYFRDTIFNYPTMAEAYKVAGLDGLNRLP